MLQLVRGLNRAAWIPDTNQPGQLCVCSASTTENQPAIPLFLFQQWKGGSFEMVSGFPEPLGNSYRCCPHRHRQVEFCCNPEPDGGSFGGYRHRHAAVPPLHGPPHLALCCKCHAGNFPRCELGVVHPITVPQGFPADSTAQAWLCLGQDDFSHDEPQFPHM